ncbi:MAG: type II secretion system protein N [Marinobacter sp.]
MALVSVRKLPFALRLANGLLLALVLYLGFIAAQLTWLLLAPQQPVSRPQASDALNIGAAGGLYPVASYSLFGSSPLVQGLTEGVKRQAPETGLQLRLSGVLVGQQSQSSGAIVAKANGDAAYYRVGDALPGNAELMEVEPGRILIRRNGQYETLTFEDPLLAVRVADIEEVTQQSGQRAELANSFLDDARARLDSQGLVALESFGLRPVQDSSAGYVYDGTNAMLNAVNLQAGDVITAINGQTLGDIEQDKILLDSWREQPQVDIEIERNGRYLTVSYAIPEQWR